MSMSKRHDQGSALVIVLIFITVFGIWLASSLLLVQVSAIEVSKAQQSIQTTSSSSRILGWALTTVQNNTTNPVGIVGQDNCGLSLPTSFSNQGFTLQCEPDPNSSLSQFGDSIIVMGINGTSGTGGNPNNGGGRGASGGGGNSAAVTYGVTIDAPTNQSVTLNSGIRNQSGYFSLNGNFNFNVNGVVRVPSGQNCASQTGSGNLNETICSKGSTSLNIKNTSYWKALLSAVGPVPTKTLTTSDFIDCTTWNSTTNSTVNFPIKPGKYSIAQVGYLNNITSVTRLADMKNLSGTPCLSTNNSPITSIQVQMQPGIYYFEGQSGTVQPWVINNPFVTVNNSPSSLNADGTCVDVTSLPDTQLRSNPNGVQMIFGGQDMALKINGGTFKTCPISYHLTPRLSFVALNGDIVAVAGGVSWSSTDYVLNIGSSTNEFRMYGGIFAPAASVSTSQNLNGTIEFATGVIAQGLYMSFTGSTKSVISVKPARIHNGNRIVNLKVKKNGQTLTTTQIEIVDDYGQSLTSSNKLSFRILSQS